LLKASCFEKEPHLFRTKFAAEENRTRDLAFTKLAYIEDSNVRVIQPKLFK
jgi:hypothetical protein